MTAFCIGIPPKIPPCGWESDSDAAAEKHTRDTHHSTTSGTVHGARAIHDAHQERA